ncbi:MAG TPA: hypothetical protein VLE23_11925 [Geminicoccaceae bacterium]|nr:hypothetical protein [Geminicoccaceae bacterium]
MQVFHLQRQVYQGARLASRLAAAPQQRQAVRRDALARWHQARTDGLSAAKAARAVGAALSTLCRWARQPVPRSRAPHRRRTPRRRSDLVRAIERLRQDFPVWGKAKLGPLLRTEGFTVSDSTVGRILKSLVTRGLIDPVPIARRRVRRGLRPSRPHARRLPRGLKASAPGSLIRIDTLTINPTGERTLKPFTAYDPVARFTTARAFRAPPATPQPSSSTICLRPCRSRSRLFRSMAAASSWPPSRSRAGPRASSSTSCRPSRRK